MNLCYEFVYGSSYVGKDRYSLEQVNFTPAPHLPPKNVAKLGEQIVSF